MAIPVFFGASAFADPDLNGGLVSYGAHNTIRDNIEHPGELDIVTCQLGEDC